MWYSNANSTWITIIYFVCIYDLWLLRIKTQIANLLCVPLLQSMTYVTQTKNVISGFSNYFKGIFSTTVVDNAAK